MLRCTAEAVSLRVLLHNGGRSGKLLLLSPMTKRLRPRRILLTPVQQTATFATTTTTSSSPSSLETFRSQLLETALTKSVPTYGWTEEAIAHAASAAASESSMSLAGLVTVSDLVAYAMDRSNATLREALHAKEWKHENDDDNDVVSNITWALQLRLPYHHNDHWHQAMALGAQPHNILRTQRQLASMIDSIADTILPSLTTPERLGLGAVYVAAELHMVAGATNDDNNNVQEATRDFLQQRVAEWDRLRRLQLVSSSSSSDVLWTMTQVTSAVLSGAQSLMMAPSSSSATNKGGTHPSEYDGQQPHPQRSNIV